MARRKGKKKDPDETYEEHEVEQDDTPQGLIPITDDKDLVLYLDEHATGDPVIVTLSPPDLVRCQCEWRDNTVETFGPKPIIRCDQEPTVVAFQKRDPDDDQPTGAMSLCDDHKTMVEHMYPGQCYFRRISSDHKIGDFA